MVSSRRSRRNAPVPRRFRLAGISARSRGAASNVYDSEWPCRKIRLATTASSGRPPLPDRSGIHRAGTKGDHRAGSPIQVELSAIAGANNPKVSKSRHLFSTYTSSLSPHPGTSENVGAARQADGQNQPEPSQPPRDPCARALLSSGRSVRLFLRSTIPPCWDSGLSLALASFSMRSATPTSPRASRDRNNNIVTGTPLGTAVESDYSASSNHDLPPDRDGYQGGKGDGVRPPVRITDQHSDRPGDHQAGEHAIYWLAYCLAVPPPFAAISIFSRNYLFTRSVHQVRKMTGDEIEFFGLGYLCTPMWPQKAAGRKID
jgi:hypothetical protein